MRFDGTVAVVTGAGRGIGEAYATALARMETPDDMADACLFLLSDHARWITGHVLNVDGGQIMRV